ncbi:MAG: protein kinase [Vicinamibacterales bacterium]
MTLPAGATLGPYEIVGQLGSGGMGAVYEARDPRLGRHVAVKVLPASFAADAARVRRFAQESRVVAMLSHPNIVTVHDVGSEASTPYLVTELLDGSTLRARLGAAMAPEQALHYASQVALGLAAAHGKGVVHRDLKPENIFIERNGRVKILDFGVAKATAPSSTVDEATAAPSTLTEPGQVIGTVAYMSPEQVAGRPVDARSDVFSLGAVLYEMLSGRRAFAGASATETMAAILRDDPDLSAMPARVSAVVQRCLAKQPDDRYQSAGDLAFQLNGLQAEGAAGGRMRRRGRAALVALLVAVVAALAGAGVSWVTARPVPATGPMPVTYERLTFRSGVVHAGRVAPDGQTILYNATWDGEPNELFSTLVGSPESRTLGHRDVDLMAVSASGELAVTLRPVRRGVQGGRGTLARVGLTGNAPRLLAEDVVAADWSPAGDLAAVRLVAGTFSVEFPLGTPIYQTTTSISAMRLAPDASRLAVFEGGEVAILDRRGQRQVLSSGWFQGSSLAWSPDGREVWFSASETVPTVATAAIFAVSLDGRVRTILRAPGGITLLDLTRDYRVLAKTDPSHKGLRFYSAATGTERDLTWFDWGLVGDLSPDLTMLLFSEGGHAAERGRTTYIRGTDGSPAVRLSDGTAQAFSPDGDRVLLLRQVGNSTRLVSVPTGVGQEILLTDAAVDCARAHWVGDGSRVVVVARLPGEAYRTFVMSATGGPLQPITPPRVTGTVVSPDGQWLLAAAPGEAIARYPIAGGPPQPIPGLDAEDGPVRWSLDGRSIYVRRDFQRDHPDAIDVFRVEVATGRRTLWKRIQPTPFTRMADLLPIAIGRDERSYAYTWWRAATDLFLIDGLR